MPLGRFAKFSFIFAVAALAAAYLILRENYQRSVKRYCSTFTVVFSAEGKDYVLARDVATVTYPHPLSYGGMAIANSPKQIGIELPSGAGIFFNVPYSVKSSLLGYPTEEPAGPDQVPYTFWLDDVRAPSRMEAYFSELYYQSASPRLRIKAMSFRDVSDCQPTEPAEEIPWLGLPRKERFLDGLFAYVVPKEEWAKYPQIAETLEHLTTFTNLPDERLRDLHGVMTGGVPTWEGPSDAIQIAGREVPGRFLQQRPKAEFVRPIVRRDGEFSLLLKDPGWVAYYPQPFNVDFRFLLRIGNRRESVAANKWYFDPISDALIRVNRITF